MNLGKTVMIVGLGSSGGWALEYLARSEGVGTIITADIRGDWGALKTNSVAAGAGQLGHSKKIEFHKCDVNDIDATAELLKIINPDVIFSAVTKLGCTVSHLLPPSVTKEDPWMAGISLALQLPLAAKLMQAVKKSGIITHVVNTCYADIVNPVLWRNGLGPLVGVGNMDNIVGEIRRKISVAENLPIRDVTVYYIAEHAINTLGTRTGVPYFFKVLVGDRDITGGVDVDSLISDRLLAGGYPEWIPWLMHPLSTSGAVRSMLAILNDTNEFAHAPGPNGLPGGYPIRINAGGVKVVLPEEVSMEEAVKINTDGMKHEGIEEIKDDGTVVFTEKACRLIKKTYGFDYRELRLVDADDRCEQILSVYKKLGWRGE